VCERGARGVFAPEVRAGWGEGEGMGVWERVDVMGWDGMGWVGR